MKPLRWNLGKNTKLKLERGVSFEMVRTAMTKGAFSVVRNPSRNHPRQSCFVVTLNSIKWLVPFREYANHIHLFTIMRA